MPRPVNAPVSFGFGLFPTDPDAVRIYEQLGLKGHNGDDYAVYMVSTFSIVRGTVIVAGWVSDGGGNSVRIRFRWRDGREYIAQHDHLSRVDVKVGQTVEVGQQVGITGDSGATAGHHLHFSIRPVSGYNPNDGYYGYVNPAPFYQAQGGADDMKLFWPDDITPLRAKFKKPIMMFNIETNEPMWESGPDALFVAKTEILHGSTFLITDDRAKNREPFGFREQDIYAAGNQVDEIPAPTNDAQQRLNEIDRIIHR